MKIKTTLTTFSVGYPSPPFFLCRAVMVGGDWGVDAQRRKARKGSWEKELFRLFWPNYGTNETVSFYHGNTFIAAVFKLGFGHLVNSLLTYHILANIAL